ncbi:ketopantoate reductase family protein [Myxosarcina sp. GI1]|uniref:ketopantoate reductase family protein n=1 Tax=Myxosarcina sp. GI1 TaxID=1541065 RepID=UPI00056CC3ED|nr:2-dehydropantoate 2-reductase N-terminal domain-containing protein [Myxosarcina sp. GI1]
MNKIMVVGIGSIGTLIGASLVKAGVEVTFAGRDRSSYTKQIKQFGLFLFNSRGEKTQILPNTKKVRFVDITEKLEEVFEIIVVAVKSNCLAAVAPYIHAHSDCNSIIFHAQNGIPYWWFADNNYLSDLNPSLLARIGSRPYLHSVDPDGEIMALLGDRHLVGCVVKAPCSKTPWGRVEVKKSPKMSVGLVTPQQSYFQKSTVEQLCQLLSNNGLTTTYHENIRTEVGQKLAINLATNVLSALTDCAIAELTANAYVNNAIGIIVAELRQIFLIYGIKKADLPSEAKVYAYITEPGSQRHLPSLAQDFARRRQGEISLITAPVEMAEIAGIKTPTLDSLAVLLQFGQSYALNRASSKFNILTFDPAFGYCVLTDEACQSPALDKSKISALLARLIQINVSALEQNVA